MADHAKWHKAAAAEGLSNADSTAREGGHCPNCPGLSRFRTDAGYRLHRLTAHDGQDVKVRVPRDWRPPWSKR